MKINYKTESIPKKTYFIKKYCCANMRKYLTEFSGFTLSQNGEVIAENDDGTGFDGYKFRQRVKYCPFCGEKIEV